MLHGQKNAKHPGIKLGRVVLRWEEKKLKFVLKSCVVHTTAKQVISLCGKDENSFEIYKNEKRTCKACKSIVFHQVVKYANL